FKKDLQMCDQKNLKLKVYVLNFLNKPLFYQFNGNDVLSLMPVSTDPNCTVCLNAFTGHYIGADGRSLKIQDLTRGRVSRDLLTPVFGGLGDPTATDIARTIQLSVRSRW